MSPEIARALEAVGVALERRSDALAADAYQRAAEGRAEEAGALVVVSTVLAELRLAVAEVARGDIEEAG